MPKQLALMVALLVAVARAHEPFIVQFQWNFINYTWPNEETMDKADYNRQNNVIAGIKLWNDKMYLTIPRWKDGVPVTLAVTSSTPINQTTAPLLEPYPSWDMQKVGDCKALQSVQSVEIDPKGRMWVLDTGRTNVNDEGVTSKCAPRLVILDLEAGGAVLRSYPFPADVADPDRSLLNDIVVDHEDGGFAYITDSHRDQPGIIVFSLENSTSWKVVHDSMRGTKEATDFKIEQLSVKDTYNIDGIALSPAYTEGERLVYYAPLSSLTLFSLPTRVLKDPEAKSEVAEAVRLMGRKHSQSNGMAMSNTGVLYFGLLADDAVTMWDTKSQPSFVTGQRIISRDHHLMQWPESFAFDQKGQLWCITNRLHLLLQEKNQISTEKPNFRAIMSKVNLRSYQYYENNTAPELPVITAGARHHQLALASLLALLLLLLVQ